MSDRPALEVAKKLNEKIEGFVGYSRSHHDIGLELMRAAQSACTAIEQLSDTIESLQREKAELQSIADAAGMDAERAITRADKAELDLKCLQESTVDAKAYQALQRENEERVKAHNEIFDALQKSEMDNEFLRGQLSDWEMTPRGAQEIIQRQADRISELEAAAITPEMRAVLKRAFALAREVEESELAEDLCGILIETDPYRNPHLNR